MAVNKDKAAQAEAGSKTDTQSKAKTEPVRQTEPVYSATELAANANTLFGVRTECAVAALRTVGITDCTVSKAREIVRTFMKKEVS